MRRVIWVLPLNFLFCPFFEAFIETFISLVFPSISSFVDCVVEWQSRDDRRDFLWKPGGRFLLSPLRCNPSPFRLVRAITLTSPFSGLANSFSAFHHALYNPSGCLPSAMYRPPPHAGTNGKKPPPQSGLRNEVFVQSDTDGAYEHDIVECPRSDEVIPETQMDNSTAATNIQRAPPPKQQLIPAITFSAAGNWERDPVQSVVNGFAFGESGLGSKKSGPLKESMAILKAPHAVDSGGRHVKNLKNQTPNSKPYSVHLLTSLKVRGRQRCRLSLIG